MQSSRWRRVRLGSVGVCLTLTPLVAQAPAPVAAITAVPFTRVTIADAFWSPRLQVSREVTIPYAFEQREKTGRIRNFERAGGTRDKRLRERLPVPRRTAAAGARVGRRRTPRRVDVPVARQLHRLRSRLRCDGCHRLLNNQLVI